MNVPKGEALDSSLNTTQLDKALAHGLARLGLGVAIALHGLVRLPELSGFAAALQQQFAETFLPGSLVYATGYCIAIGEAVIGILLVLGLWLRTALTAGSLLMILLLIGTCLLQNWSVAGLQLGYLALYSALLATATCDRFSIDGVLRSRPGGNRASIAEQCGGVATHRTFQREHKNVGAQAAFWARIIPG